jgi:hypothetical protein
MMDTIYRKSLRLSGGDVSRMGVGGISNLQSNDIRHLEWVPMALTAVWQAPFEVCFLPQLSSGKACFTMCVSSTVRESACTDRQCRYITATEQQRLRERYPCQATCLHVLGANSLCSVDASVTLRLHLSR